LKIPEDSQSFSKKYRFLLVKIGNQYDQKKFLRHTSKLGRRQNAEKEGEREEEREKGESDSRQGN
jgi:hypothetical protein